MSDDILPILPTADDIVRPGVDTLRALRPGSAKFLNNDLAGNYGKIVHGIRAQATLALNRLADGVANGRLPSATGDGLKNLVLSEFGTPETFDPTSAVGLVVLTRTAGTYPAGTIKKGTRFKRSRNLTATIPYADATYQSTIDILVPASATQVSIPIVAQTAGANANQQVATGFTPATTDLSVADPIFDTNLKVTTLYAGGGSDNVADAYLRQFATASAQGQFGSNEASTLAGAYAAAGVRYVLVRDDSATGIQTAYIADASWGSSQALADQTTAYLTDNNVFGFGCRAQVLPAGNRVIGVTATVTLRSTDYLSQIDDITASVQSALTNYFDNSVNWDIFRLRSIRGVIARADLRILTCTLASVVDGITGATVSEPSFTAPPFLPFGATHWFLVNNGTNLTFSAPT